MAFYVKLLMPVEKRGIREFQLLNRATALFEVEAMNPDMASNSRLLIGLQVKVQPGEIERV
jgi:hypothetical protein